MTHKTETWFDLFKSDVIRQVIVFCVFVGSIVGVSMGVYVKAEAMLSEKYSTKSDLATTQKSFADHCSLNERQFDDISKQLSEIRGYVVQIARKQ